ncbi:hypothetical protein [Flavobacterium sp. MDT1-60]|uniref:hypothetical protein n=1 Tax=Flavobacterium sp. MDT1-60 TaxID=1979344 RepID=UPI0017841B49|nr:hypothetical protein [Flavobacterium sp. MDT1-60]QOG01214.1 hypothetical protein IHE43_15510 [Flavobacterium sp. MDT1-60]
MILTKEQKKGQDVFFSIIAEAWENDDFKKSLIKNPEKTLAVFFGRNLPIGKKIKVTDQSDPEFLYINIPIKMKPEDQEPDEKKIDNCSGSTSNGSAVTDFESLYDSLRGL